MRNLLGRLDAWLTTRLQPLDPHRRNATFSCSRCGLHLRVRGTMNQVIEIVTPHWHHHACPAREQHTPRTLRSRLATAHALLKGHHPLATASATYFCNGCHLLINARGSRIQMEQFVSFFYSSNHTCPTTP